MASVTFKGNPMTLVGNEVKVGESAPDFTVLANDLSEVKLSDNKGTVRLISVVPSVDTGVCAAQTKRFIDEIGKLGDVSVLTISADLPFAQARWAQENGFNDAKIFSDHRDLSFGEAYGVIMKELRLLARSVFVIDSNDKVVYAEYVAEGTNHPDYDKALEAAKQAK
ncbi:thiol peroxidase [Lederbergia lenta]|uniref:thiol peroxidase n=1 Tax=Lederbergia lenta TaxID=1467 RepID=UPI00203D28F1|nr:thiol peroxidase [Lederbergia lenta]MCM3111105.1 thiol peroxidase [Lederbergia lenta]